MDASSAKVLSCWCASSNFMLPRYYNQPYAASLHKSFNDNYDEVFRVDNGYEKGHKRAMAALEKLGLKLEGP